MGYGQRNSLEMTLKNTLFLKSYGVGVVSEPPGRVFETDQTPRVSDVALVTGNKGKCEEKQKQNKPRYFWMSRHADGRFEAIVEIAGTNMTREIQTFLE